MQTERRIVIGHYVVGYILGILEWKEHDERTDRSKRGQHFNGHIGKFWLWSMEARFVGVVEASV